jgi:hypothetical protein
LRDREREIEGEREREREKVGESRKRGKVEDGLSESWLGSRPPQERNVS